MPDDETVNQMIARSEEEFEIYQVSLFPFEIREATRTDHQPVMPRSGNPSVDSKAM